tara:strand:- start:33 stop:434 length:402 start_codon:yes stop_codon:yes gene_type:complete
MITLINPPGLKTFSGLNMNTPAPPISLAYIAGTLKEAGIDFRVIDAAGEALDQIQPYEKRNDFMAQGLLPVEVVERIPTETSIVGVTCTFSSYWPIVRIIGDLIRERFPTALLVLGGEHGTALPEHSLERRFP